MKKAVLFVAVSVLMLMISCGDEQPTKVNENEKILQIKHSLYYGECLGYCDTDVQLDSMNAHYIQRGWTETEVLPTKDSSFSISFQQMNGIFSSFNIDNVFTLDTIYQPLDQLDVGYFTIEITTSLRHKKIQFNRSKYLPPVDSLNKLLMELRKQLKT